MMIRWQSVCMAFVAVFLVALFLVAASLVAVLPCFATVAGQDVGSSPAPAEANLPADSTETGVTDVFRVLQMTLDGAVSPASQELLSDVLEQARSNQSDLVLIVLDTPGGLSESMRDMVKQMLNSAIPVAVWVGPSGARAASAGVFLVAASAVAAMAPNTTIGAASPVDVGGTDMDETMARKVKNDIMSLVRAMAQSRGRNVEWYEKAVDESVSITASEAVMKRVVEHVAVSPRDMLEQVSARGIRFGGKTIAFSPDQVKITLFEPGFRNTFLTWLLNPSIAYLLLLGGMAGLFFELTSPGSIFPGVFGGICMLLALYALAILPTNLAGVLLLLFGLLLFGLEIKITSFGLLGVGGAVCLFVGSVILFRGGGQGMGVPMSMILSTVITLTVFLALVVRLVVRARKQAYPMGESAMIGMSATVREWNADTGTIMVRGEIWSARCQAGQQPKPGETVTIVATRGLKLIVEPVSTN